MLCSFGTLVPQQNTSAIAKVFLIWYSGTSKIDQSRSFSDFHLVLWYPKKGREQEFLWLSFGTLVPQKWTRAGVSLTFIWYSGTPKMDKSMSMSDFHLVLWYPTNIQMQQLIWLLFGTLVPQKYTRAAVTLYLIWYSGSWKYTSAGVTYSDYYLVLWYPKNGQEQKCLWLSFGTLVPQKWTRAEVSLTFIWYLGTQKIYKSSSPNW
jgi:hypothetical protein